MICWLENLKLRYWDFRLKLRDGETMRMPHKAYKKEWCNLCCDNTIFCIGYASDSFCWEWFCEGCGYKDGKLFNNKDRIKHLKWLINARREHVKKRRMTLKEYDEWWEEIKKHYGLYISEKDFKKLEVNM